MQLNRIIALVLVIVCLAAAAFGIQNRRAEEASFGLKALNTKSDRLELLTLEGAITGSRSSLTGAMSVRNRLTKLEKDNDVKGVLLTINTPGGTVGASKEVYEAVKRLAQVKPVVVSMLDQATSGGYYVASAATKIYANGGTLTGSIGVILSSFNISELLNRVGVEPQTVKTGPYKDIFSPYRKSSEAEQQLLQELLQNTYRQFITDVAAGRKMDLEAVRKLADGRIYTGEQAKANGLVDAIGTYNDAVEDLRKLAIAKFKLPEGTELEIKGGSSTFEQFFDQLVNQSTLHLGTSTSISGVLEGLADKFLNITAPNISNEISNNDPPILLMPSWYQ